MQYGAHANAHTWSKERVLLRFSATPEHTTRTAKAAWKACITQVYARIRSWSRVASFTECLHCRQAPRIADSRLELEGSMDEVSTPLLSGKLSER